MAYETITYETRGQVGVLTLNRPEKLNAISAELRAFVLSQTPQARTAAEVVREARDGARY